MFQIELPPSSEDIVSAEAAVEEQAAAVRNLKEGQGRTNLVGHLRQRESMHPVLLLSCYVLSQQPCWI